jgi:hypothetical protein
MAVPPIVTGWSGLADFIDDEIGYLIDYKLVDVSVEHA